MFYKLYYFFSIYTTEVLFFTKMKLRIFTFFIWFFLLSQSVLACVFDTSNTTLNIRGNKVTGSSSFHPFQIDYLLRKNDKSVSEAEKFMLQSDFIESYISDNIGFYNSWESCIITQIELLEVDPVNIFFEWVEIVYSLECDEIIHDARVTIDFFSEIGRQTNMLRVIYWDDPKYQIYEPLDPEYIELSFNTLTHEYVFDGSFLDDQRAQIIHNQDIHSQKIESSEDNYCNVMDLDTLWYTHIWDASMCDIIDEAFIETWSSSSLMNINQDDTIIAWLYTRVQKNLQKALIEWNIWIIWLSFIIFLLWFLHAAWPGHSKTVLTALMIDNNSSFRSGLKYIISYTLTHYIDIIIFSIIVSAFLYSFDITQYYGTIQIFSAIMLLWLSIFLIYKSLKSLKHNMECSCCKIKNKSNTSPVLLWFFSWVVPCMLAWTLFFLLTSLWLIQYIIFMILALIWWTFTFLFWLLIVIWRVRSFWFLRFQKYLRYTPLLSSCMLLAISLSIFYVNI